MPEMCGANNSFHVNMKTLSPKRENMNTLSPKHENMKTIHENTKTPILFMFWGQKRESHMWWLCGANNSFHVNAKRISSEV